MSRAKRRQRSTQIRKRIEKKQREEDKARKREAKGQQKDQDLVLRMIVDREPAQGTLDQLRDLESRLSEAPIRGWTTDDLSGEHGLSELADLIGAAFDRQPAGESKDDRLIVELTVGSRAPLLERLSALEIAAPGLKVEWEAGFSEVAQAIGQASEEMAMGDEEEGAEGAEGAEGESAEGESAEGESAEGSTEEGAEPAP